MRTTTLALAAGSAALALGLTGCGATGGSSPAGPHYNGAELTQPITAPAGTFTSTAGGSDELATHLKGHVTLVYFGYTHCPDVCPTTMADLGAALRSVPAATAADVHVVFVTSDPARDTVPVMRSWLANFDSGLAHPFVGLTTSVPAVDAYAAKLGVPLDPPAVKGGKYEVSHGAQVLAFGANGTADLVWLPDGMTVQQYASDITTLTRQPA